MKIQLNAFIPASFGVSIQSYEYLPIGLKNQQEFMSKVRSVSGKWGLEPFSKTGYFATDNREFGQPGTSRVFIIAEFDPAQTGNLSKIGIKSQIDSSPSYRIEIVKTTNSSGVFGSLKTEVKKALVSSKKRVEDPTDEKSIIAFSASSGYPFKEPFSPNIDMELIVEITQKINKYAIKLSGSINEFPAYEILLNNKLLHKFLIPPDNYGPGLKNLNKSVRFDIPIFEV